MVRFILALAATAVSAPTGWPIYENARYGYSVCHSPELRPRPEAPNGDGRHFLAADGADLSIYGSNDPDNGGYQAELNYFREDARKVGGSITYAANGKNWGVISGVAAGKVFYVKVFVHDGQLVTFDFSYPQRYASRYSQVTGQMVRCFRPGHGSF